MKPNSTSRDVILTMQHKGAFAAVAPLVRSLKRTGYRGRVVMFTSRLEPATLEQLREHGVELEPFTFIGRRIRQPLAKLWPLWRGYFSSRASAEAKRWLARRVFHLFYRRYLLYEAFLARHGGEFDRVMLTDSRDVFFQRDPFCWNPPPGLHCVLEEDSVRIGSCRLHQLWMGCQFGEDFVRHHAEWIASCAGTTFGDTASLRQYLTQMIAGAMSARNLARIAGGDQGIHNYLLIQKRLPGVTVHPNRHAPVLTMGVMNPGEVRFNAADEVLNENGEVAPVLHQYDRLPEVKQRLLAGLGRRP